jgi:hypothetical protein
MLSHQRIIKDDVKRSGVLSTDVCGFRIVFA